MKRHPKAIWDRQGRLIFEKDQHYKSASPLKHGLPARSTPHSRKRISWGSTSKKI